MADVCLPMAHQRLPQYYVTMLVRGAYHTVRIHTLKEYRIDESALVAAMERCSVLGNIVFRTFDAFSAPLDDVMYHSNDYCNCNRTDRRIYWNFYEMLICVCIEGNGVVEKYLW